MEDLKPNQLKTVSDFVAAIPQRWRNAEIGIDNGIGDPQPIRRVSFHKNHKGRMIVLFHQKDFNS